MTTKWIWWYPICLANPDRTSCNNNCQKDYTSNSGKIIVDLQNFQNYQSCLWTITVDSGKSLEFQFDQSAGFDIEYHQFCGFDRLHIFSGDKNGEYHRHARLCGPKGKQR